MSFTIQFSPQYFDKILLNGLIRRACYFSAAHPQESKAVPDVRVGSLSSFITFITSGIPTQFMKLIWSKHGSNILSNIQL